MYHVSAQGVDERMINLHYYMFLITQLSCKLGIDHLAEMEGNNILNICQNI